MKNLDHEPHSPAEEAAFDEGLAAGEAKGIDAVNPFDSITQFYQWDAWETGKSVGVKNR